jgi:hypothetical protein
MHSAYLLLAFACLPVLAQEPAPLPLPQPERTLKDLLHIELAPQQSLRLPSKASTGTCSIPLLNARQRGNPVKMPEIKPPRRQVDKLMPNSVPAPACQSRLADAGAPATPPPGKRAPRKP